MLSRLKPRSPPPLDLCALKKSPKTFYRFSKFLEYRPIVLIAATRHIGLFEQSDI